MGFVVLHFMAYEVSVGVSKLEICQHWLLFFHSVPFVEDILRD